MKRRHALRHIGAGLSAGFVLPWLTSCKDDEVNPAIKYDGTVGIIGAGAAGLFAGDYLIDKGIKVEILEASERIGGRIRTLRSYDAFGPGLWYNKRTNLSNDFPTELGADRILGKDNSIWYKFVSQQKYDNFVVPPKTNDRYWINNALIDYPTASTDASFQSAENFVNAIPSNVGASGTVEEYVSALGLSQDYNTILEGWVGNQNGTSNDRLGMGGIAEAATLRQRTDESFLLAHNPMADVLIGSFIRASEAVKLNCVVREINYSGPKIVVSGERTVDGAVETFSYEYDKLIIAVPISILKTGLINFTPALPSSKTAALGNMSMDSAIRVILDFRKNFWGAGFRNIYGGSTGIEYFNPGGSGRSTVARTLSVTISGKRAQELSPLGMDIIPELLSELDLMFDGEATANVRKDNVNDEYIAAIQDWGKEPFIQGSMSYLKPGGSNNDRAVLAETVNEVLYFAGEATDVQGEAGTINGALQSAERAAKEIIESITT